jgi:hypothetical protein
MGHQFFSSSHSPYLIHGEKRSFARRSGTLLVTIDDTIAHQAKWLRAEGFAWAALSPLRKLSRCLGTGRSADRRKATDDLSPHSGNIFSNIIRNIGAELWAAKRVSI